MEKGAAGRWRTGATAATEGAVEQARRGRAATAQRGGGAWLRCDRQCLGRAAGGAGEAAGRADVRGDALSTAHATGRARGAQAGRARRLQHGHAAQFGGCFLAGRLARGRFLACADGGRRRPGRGRDMRLAGAGRAQQQAQDHQPPQRHAQAVAQGRKGGQAAAAEQVVHRIPGGRQWPPINGPAALRNCSWDSLSDANKNLFHLKPG
ncbi:MAG: hypothetical protein ACWGG5_08675 [Stenotrophomonas sp.]